MEEIDKNWDKFKKSGKIEDYLRYKGIDKDDNI